MKKYYVFASLVLLAATPGFAQVKIGAAGAPDTSAMLEITGGAANNKGLLMPRMSTTQRNAISGPAKGLMIYNITTNEAQVNTGTPAAPVWAAANSTTSGWNATGNAGTAPATNFIGTTDNQPLVVRTNNTEKMRITATGNVGIGTNAPAVQLQITDTGKVALRIGSPNGNGGNIELGNANHGLVRGLTGSGGHANDIALYTSSGNALGASLYLVASPISAQADSLPLDQFVLKSTGNVGIGTNAPTAKLHVNNGNLTITNDGPTTSSAISIISDNTGGLNPDNINITAYGSSNALFGASVARGTASAPQNSQAGDNTGQIVFAPRVNGAFKAISGISSVYLGDGITEKSRLSFNTSNTSAMIIDSSGNVGIGVTTPKVKLQIQGGLLLRNDVNIAHGNGTFITWSTVRTGVGETEFINYRGTGSGGFRFYDVNPGATVDTAVDVPASLGGNQIAFIAPGTGAYSALSDMRVKTNVNIINDGLEKVMAVRPVSYDLHTGRKLKDGVVTFTKDDKIIPTIGFVAQELEKVVPEAVITPKDPANEFYTVSYSIMIPVLTKAIQEQQAEIEALKAELAATKTANATLKADVSKITALAEKMEQLEALMGTSAKSTLTASK